jgi:hypothetical protein
MALKQFQRLWSTRSYLFFNELLIGYLKGIQFLSLLLDEKDGAECEGLSRKLRWTSCFLIGFFNLLSS